MALATRCPACSTIFRISTAQAAAKGGMVRCGQCRNVFNSLDALVRVEDLDVVDEIVVAPAPIDDAVALDEEAAFDPEPPSPLPEVAAADASLAAPSQRLSTGEWWLPEQSLARGPSTGASLATAGHANDASSDRASSIARDPDDSVALNPETVMSWGGTTSGTGPVFMQPSVPTPSNRSAHWTWSGLALLALVLLLVQVAYLWRNEIAVRWSPARPWLIAACAAAGCKVDYPAHADSITIESASIQTSAANANLYVLTALLRNRDVIDVRYPYIELLLTDLQDKVVARRVLRPEDYLLVTRDGSGLASPGFAAQSESPIRLTFELNGLRFAGYRLDKFYP